MNRHTPEEKRNIATVNAIFEGPADFDRVTAFAEGAVWWNGLPRMPGAEGVTEHRGIEAIKRILYGAGQPHEGTGIDSYDLATNRFTDIVVLADGDYVVRQHTQHSKTLKGRPYRNVYCFVFKFNREGKIQYLTEHWNTFYANKVLFDNWDFEPAHPEG